MEKFKKGIRSDWCREDADSRLQYLKVKSNKKKLLSDNIINDYDFYEEYLKNSIDSLHYLENYDKIKEKIIVKGAENLKSNVPYFYCSFHLGPLTILPFFLSDKGIDFLFIGSTEVYNKKEKFLNLMRKYNLNFTEEDFCVGDTKSGMIKIIKKSKERRSFFSYVDIAVGSDNIKDNKHKVPVKLNGVELYARMGIPHLANHFNMPIVPIFSYFEDDKIVIDVCKPIKNSLSDRNQSSIKITQYLWNLFEPLFNKFPTQWETLHTVHQYYIKQEQDNSKLKLILDYNYIFNQDRYDFLIRDESFYLFDILNAKTLLLSKNLYKFLKKMYVKKIKLNGKELQHFIKNGKLREALIIKEVFV